MGDTRAQTLEALSTLVQAQRLSLARVQSDIERLRKLRDEALAQPEHFMSNLGSQLEDQAFKLSQQLDVTSSPPNQIDWSLYASHDPSPLRTLALNARIAYSQRNQPRTTQLSELSDLQKFVKEARRDIVDPILANLALDNTALDDSEEEEELDPEELKRERERAKIRELKKRKISCGLTIPLRSRATNGVFIRRDLDDESAEVDISLNEDSDGDKLATQKSVPMDIDMGNGCGLSHADPALSPPLIAKPLRSRRPTSKLQESLQSNGAPTFTKSVRRKSSVAEGDKLQGTRDVEPVTETGTTQLLKDTGKPKSETYKKSWSVSEQHLLERLLDEIPEGEKNRWQKISRAMMGRRTPRQVASRVQKYFEKLKRFGVSADVGGLNTDVH